MIFRLTSRDAKAHRLAELGLDGMIVLGFDSALATLTPRIFARDPGPAARRRRGRRRL